MPKVSTDPKKIEEILTRGVEKVVVAESLRRKLMSGKPLRIKHGVDPTTPDLHLGYSAIYWKLRTLQELGHTVIFLIGGFTARFGDPTAKLEERAMRSRTEVGRLAKNYIAQAGKIIDLSKAEVRDNSEWYDKMSAEELLALQSEFTKAQMEERDMFEEREREGREIRLHELVYPALQGYDSVVLKSDATVVGSDQLFNELQARPLQKSRKQKPQDVLTMKLLVGTDGIRKMSQSLGNYIGITEEAKSQYGKIMSISDHLIAAYFELCTQVPMAEIQKMERDMKNGTNPRICKARLAHTIVTMYHSKKVADETAKQFDKLFREHEAPEEMKEVKVKKVEWNVVDLLVETKLAPSKSDARRLIEQGGVKIGGRVEKATDAVVEIPKDGIVLQRGKRHFVRVIK